MATAVEKPQAPTSGNPEGTIARLGGKIRKWKDSANQAAKERDALKAELDKATAQIKDLAGKADGNEAAKQRDQLAQQLRDIKHQAAFRKVADPAGKMSDAQFKDLWQLSGYKAEAEEPDAKAIAAVIDTQRKERSYLFGPQGQQQAAGEQAIPAAVYGKGQSDMPNQGHYVVSRAQAADPVFMMANAGKIAAASAEGRFQIADNMLIQ